MTHPQLHATGCVTHCALEQSVARRAHNPKAVGSSPTRATAGISSHQFRVKAPVRMTAGKDGWAGSSIGRAAALQAEGCGFESRSVHLRPGGASGPLAAAQCGGGSNPSPGQRNDNSERGG